jgi:uncharacterized protein involved in exopolysaccharide biosynthesis
MKHTEEKFYPYQDDEITLKELILKIQEFWQVLWNKKWVIIGLSLLFAVLFILWNSRKETLYTSAVTFMVGESDSKSKVMATPFQQVEFEGIKNHKITVIARASKIVHQVLLTEDNNRTVADKLIEVYGLKEKWSNYDWSLIDFNISDRAQLNQETKTVFDKLHEFLVGNKLRDGSAGLMSITFDDETEIFKLSIKTVDKTLSPYLRDVFYKTISEFYVDRTVGRAERSYHQLVVREDSLLSVVNKAESELAYSSDRTRGVVSSLVKVNQSRISRKLENVTSQYMEVRANRQKIEYVLQTQTPDFQILDQTFVPIVAKTSLAKSGIMGAFLGVFLCVLFIIVRHIILTALAE